MKNSILYFDYILYAQIISSLMTFFKLFNIKFFNPLYFVFKRIELFNL